MVTITPNTVPVTCLEAKSRPESWDMDAGSTPRARMREPAMGQSAADAVGQRREEVHERHTREPAADERGSLQVRPEAQYDCLTAGGP